MVKLLRYFLGCLLAFSALNAFGGGIYAIMGAENVPVEWLKGSPFTSYFVPGLILFFIVGGSFLTSSVLMFLNSKHAFKASYFSVFIVFIWLVVQVSIIGYVSWMQPTTAAVAILIFILTTVLTKNKR